MGTVNTTIALGTPGLTKAASHAPGTAGPVGLIVPAGASVVSAWPNAGIANPRSAAPKTRSFIRHLHQAWTRRVVGEQPHGSDTQYDNPIQKGLFRPLDSSCVSCARRTASRTASCRGAVSATHRTAPI